MKKILLLFAFISCTLLSFAQDERPVCTPEEEAGRMTQQLVRELSLTQQQTDTIYRLHLKYAKLRRESNTRQQALERMNACTEELLQCLTPEQRELFLNKQVNPHPRRPQSRVGCLGRDSLAIMSEQPVGPFVPSEPVEHR